MNLTGLTSFFPWNLIIALFLAFTFAVIGVAIFKHSIKKSEEEPAPKEPSRFLEKWKTSVAQFGFFPTNSFSKSFVHALNIMHSFIGGRGFRYQLPWIVVLGAKESGKSTILQSLDLDRPIGRPNFSAEEGDQPLCDWWFYDHGVALDLDGKIVLNSSQVLSDEDNWQLFLNLLTHHRPKRPLDGVVLTIPASEIVGPTALSHDDIMIRAEYLYGKLWNMQRITGIRVPIYLVVTKCDFVPGFESICKSIPTHNKHDIFGWSNDEPIDAVYNSDWVDTAFSSLNDSLYRIQEEIYAYGKAVDGRNGVFMFPLSFNTLKGGIRTYTNHLFKESSYHESFFLRGIYFIGDSHLDRGLPLSNPSTSALLTPKGGEEPQRRNIYFANNLFENKIFRELGLARPVSRALLGNTRTMRAFKAAVAIAAIIGTLGLLRANGKLQEANANLAPALSQVEQTLDEIRGQNETTESTYTFFEDRANTLLTMMTSISVSHVSSAFIPASWFSTLDKKIKYVMGLAYEQVIFRAMATELDMIAKKLTTSPHTLIAVAEVPVDGVDPLKTKEFYNLREYTSEINQLEDIAKKFNDPSSTLKDIGQIIKYLFKFEMPLSFYENDEYYIQSFTKTHIVAFDFTKYQEQATRKLSTFFAQFQDGAFDPNRRIPGLQKLTTSINNFSGTQNYAAYDVDLLRAIFCNLKETINSIKNPALNWIDLEYFDPGLPYDNVKKIILTSKFFDTRFAETLAIEVNRNFINFRKLLAGYKSSLFGDGGPLKQANSLGTSNPSQGTFELEKTCPGTYKSFLFSGGPLFEARNGLAISSPAPGALNLQENLTTFFSQPFMALATDKVIVTEVPLGAVLFWDTLRLQEANRLVDDYNKFMNSRFLSLPKALQPILQKVGREGLTKNLVSLIADAQIFNSDVPIASRIAPEDTLLPQVQNYRVVALYLEQLLLALKANNANTAFSSLKNILSSQTYALLEKLDHILENEAPYAIKLNSFEWWGGKNMAALEAFSVLNLNELKHYLELQRERINYLAREFAGPLVAFLEKINSEGMPGNFPLLSKWEGIIGELSEYDRKGPGNGLVELEKYIMAPLNEVTIETCNKYANITSMISANEAYFIDILFDIQLKLHEQCVALSGVESVSTYTKLSQFFNANLAGKFPFVEKINNTAPDANPEDIRTFFEMMDTLAGVKATLTEAVNLGAQGKKALTFIEQMEQVRKFFGGYLAPNSSLPTPAFSFDVAFRVNRDKEFHSNAVLDWELIAQDTMITMRSPSHVGYWEAGAPLKVIFRWALNSPLQPMIVEDLPNFDVQGENATFSYDGVWALLRLLRQHQASSTDFTSLNDDNPITLRFDIPLTNVVSQDIPGCANNSRKATLFIRLKVSPLVVVSPKKLPAPEKGEGENSTQEKIKMGAPVNLPYFPFHAPRLEPSEV